MDYKAVLLVGRMADEIFPDIIHIIRPHCEAALDGQERYYEVEYFGRLFSNHVLPIKNDSGITSHALVVTEDITKLRQDEKALQESEASISAILEAFPGMLNAVDNDYNIINASKLLIEATGYTSKKDVIGGKCYSIWKKRNAICPECGVQQVFASGRPIIRLCTPEEAKLTGIRSDLYVAPIVGENGNINGAVEIMLDISDRLKAEEALRESQMFLQETQQVARLGGWKANPQTDELKWTDGVYDIVEVPRSYQPGLAEGLKYYCPEYLFAIQESLNKCLDDGEPFLMEAKIITGNGNRRWIELRGFSGEDHQNKPVVMGTIQDISDRKQAEKEKQKLKLNFNRPKRWKQ